MKTMLRSGLIALALMFGLTAVVVPSAGAINVFNNDVCKSNDESEVCKAKADSLGGSGGPIQSIISILLFAVGVISVIMIIIGGIRYTLSNGDASQITSAKNTVLYAVIGLIVSMLAYAIVNFVVGRF